MTPDVAMFLACLPASIPDICTLTHLDVNGVLRSAQMARAEGHPVIAVPDPTVANVPARAAPGSGLLTVAYDFEPVA